jgi:hypothetical protein
MHFPPFRRVKAKSANKTENESEKGKVSLNLKARRQRWKKGKTSYLLLLGYRLGLDEM